MAQETYDKLQSSMVELRENPYTGRGIVMGLSTLGDTALQAYWVMGRSENSRNRVLVQEGDEVKTQPFDPDKVVDPSLIIYTAMRQVGRFHAVSNGVQTDAIVQERAQRQLGTDFKLKDALQSFSYEPDEPNFTPRISGYMEHFGIGSLVQSGISIIRKTDDSDQAAQVVFETRFTSNFQNGQAWGVHTYQGDGNPLPSFSGEPMAFPLAEGARETAEMYWEHLNPDNGVAIAVKGIDLVTNKTNYHIINARSK